MNDDVETTTYSDADNYIIASDGKRFDNSVSGSVDLQRYEDRLRAVK
jgi:hypothetical protein